MTNKTTTNFLDLIEIESFKFHPHGLEEVYNCFGNQYTIPAFSAFESAHLLKEIDFIADFTGAGNEVAVEYERLEDGELIQQHWCDFIKESGFDERDALSIAALMEAKKQAQREAKPFDRIKAALYATCCPNSLTNLEQEVFEQLKKVSTNTIWGLAIATVCKNPLPSTVRQLFVELKSQAVDDQVSMYMILGTEAYHSIVNL